MCRRESVVVTGLGATTPIGGDVGSTWAGLIAGRSGARRLEQEWAAGLPVHVAAPAAVDPAEVIARAEARTLDRAQQLALVAAREAWADAGVPDVAPERLAVVIASGVGGVLTLLAQYEVFKERGARRLSPYGVPMLIPNGPAATVGIALGARAGVHTPVSACASGAEAIAVALGLLRTGHADVVVCGGTEAAIHPLPLAGFAALRALSTREDPDTASRPFDKDRDGFVLGEGAGVLVLETAAHAAASGRVPYAVLAGVGLSADAYHIVQPEPEGLGAARAVSAALEDAQAAPTDVVHVNAHATATTLGDLAEARALRRALGGAADGVAVSATKSMTGHLLGAAGAVEAVVTVLALAKGQAPATINLEDQDDAVDLDIVRLDPRSLPGGVAISNSFGFGGHNVALAFRSLDGSLDGSPCGRSS